MTTRFLLTVLTILTVLSSPVYAAAEKGDSIFDDILAQEKALQVLTARNRLADLIKKAPENVGYQEHYAWFLNEHGFPEEGVKIFALLSRAKPTDAVYRGLGWNQLTVGDLPGTLATYHRLFPDISPDTSDSQALSEIRRRISDENMAKIASLKLRLSKSPADLASKKELFRSYTYQARWDDALIIGKQIRGYAPEDLLFHWEFARMLYWAGRLEQADSEFAFLASTHPKNAFILWELAKVQSARNRLMDAGKTLEAALRLAPGTPEIMQDLAEMYARQGNGKEAQALVSQLRQNRERPLTADLTEARCYHFTGEQKKAATIYRKILALYPANRDALWGLAETAFNIGKTGEAVKNLDSWEALNPADPKLGELRTKVKARTAPRLSILSDLYSNSNRYLRVNSGAQLEGFPWPDHRFLIGYNFSRFSQNGFTTINRQSVFLQTELKPFSFLTLNGRVDGHFYDNLQNRANVRIAATITPNSSSIIKFSYEHIDINDIEPVFANQLYNYVVSIGATALKLTTNDYSLFLRQELFKEVALWGKLTYGDYSDGNRKLSAVAGVEYSPAMLPDLKAKYSYFYLDYAHPASRYVTPQRTEAAYYDPSNFSVHTVGLAYQTKSGHFDYGGEWNLSYLAGSNGFGNTINGFVALAINDRQKLRCLARYYYQNKGENRDSSSGHFTAEQFLLNYEIMF